MGVEPHPHRVAPLGADEDRPNALDALNTLDQHVLGDFRQFEKIERGAVQR